VSGPGAAERATIKRSCSRLLREACHTIGITEYSWHARRALDAIGRRYVLGGVDIYRSHKTMAARVTTAR
jgi:hypothetical protein